MKTWHCSVLRQPKRSQGAEIAKHFTALGISRVALTFGGDGAWLQVDGKSAEQDVPKVTVVDTVGAGDTFWGNCLGDWVLNPARRRQPRPNHPVPSHASRRHQLHPRRLPAT